VSVIPGLEPAETPIQRLLETVGHGDNPEADDGFYCKECLPLFQDQSDPADINGPSFILDFPTSMGVPQRALLTIPYGLMIGRSSIPGAGVGVINHGPTVSPGMHFGPIEGEVTTKENAVESDFSWEIYKGKDEYEYIDAAGDLHSNWMRYVNFARNKDETNLLAVQYKGSILFHCCRTVSPGDELMVWPSSKLLDHFSEAWMQVWHKLCVHSNKRPYCCPQCRRSFSQASGLIRHQLVHRKQTGTNETDTVPDQKEPEESLTLRSELLNAAPPAEETKEVDMTEDPQEAVDVNETETASTETSQSSCLDCGKSFTSEAYLRKHKLTIHKGIRPYVCTVCQKCFGQYSDLNRHLRGHQIQNKRCSLAFASAESLQQHTRENHSEETTAGNEDDDQSCDPDFNPPKSPMNTPCNRCKRTYGNQEELKAHKCALRQHKCGQCGATFIKSGFLKRHEQTAHVDSKSFSCERCGKAFTTSANLKQHQKSNKCKKYHCTSELFSCSFCQFSFTLKSYLMKHIKRHHPAEYLSLQDSDGLADQLEEEEGKECVCPHCGENFSGSKALKSHACFQQVKVLYLCTDCGKGFTNHFGLKQHQRIHTGEKPYSCPHCSKSFSYTGQLNVHLRTHTGEKPYLCTHCGESFRQSGDLKRHERKHTGVRPYSCPECCKSFSRPQSLKAHQMLHLGQRMFKCAQCGKSFSRNYHLRRHHQKMHL
uniref:PR domain zinc finger protein 1 n=1 Tax=Labrus bergylta TaxID=56723 RepID=A0A3Q3H1I2_9LABR